MQQSTLRLTLDVDYDLNGENIKTMENHLDAVMTNAIGNGMLSGDTEAEVSSHGYTIRLIDPTPATSVKKTTDSIVCLINMSHNHIEDIDLGLSDGSYEIDDNDDIEDKRAAMNLVCSQQERIKASLTVCEGVDTRLLADMSEGYLTNLRDRAHLDRSMSAEMRELLEEIVQEVRALGVPSTKLDEAERFLKATEDDAVGRPGAKLVQFIEQVAQLQKWGGGSNEMEDAPSDGTDDSHACLMDLIDQARDILKP